MSIELNGKLLELLRTAFPGITAVTALVNPASTSSKLAFEQTETAARLMGLGGVGKAEAGSAAACASCVQPSSREPTPWS
jgi:hypothetical protein